jgi:hypothetical protein
VVSSQFWPGLAPHVGQRTACTCLRLGFLAFTVVYDAETRSKEMFNLVQKTRIVVETYPYRSLTSGQIVKWPSMRRPVGVKRVLLVFRWTRFFSRRVASGATLPSALFIERFSLGDRNGSARFLMCIKRAEKMTLAALPQAEQIACFFRHYARVVPSPFPVLSGDH